MTLACYGSHPQRGLNEVFSDLLAYLNGLKCPSVVAGDLNDSHLTSVALSMCAAVGVHDLAPNLPTTVKKDEQIAKTLPIDHVVANRSALDCTSKVRAQYRIFLSDHFPLVFNLNMTLREDLHLCGLPYPRVLTPVNQIPWEHSSHTYQDCLQNAKMWKPPVSAQYLLRGSGS